MSVQCFLLQPVPKIRIWLRRYHSSNDGLQKCPAYAYHNAVVFLTDADCPLPVDGADESYLGIEKNLRPDNTDERWPKKCDHCDYLFTETDEWQMFTHRMYRRDDNGELTTLYEAGPGAMWYATWYRRDDGGYGWDWDNQIEPPLVVNCPDGHTWNIDSRCNNCGLPNDRTHRCWVRIGTPPNITVGKGPGPSCAAGGGSIITPGGHWMLENGSFRSV